MSFAANFFNPLASSIKSTYGTSELPFQIGTALANELRSYSRGLFESSKPDSAEIFKELILDAVLEKIFHALSTAEAVVLCFSMHCHNCAPELSFAPFKSILRAWNSGVPSALSELSTRFISRDFPVDGGPMINVNLGD